MTLPLSGGAGFGVRLLDSASSSGTESRRVMLNSPVRNFGLTVIHSPTSNGVEVVLRGSASMSTESTGIDLLTKTSGQASGLTQFSTITPQPVMQVWAQLTVLATTSGASSTGSVDAWVAAI